MTPKQNKALAALLTTPNHEEAARSIGISSRTLRSYLADPTFQAEYRKAVSEIVETATRQAQQNMEPAVATLRAVMKDESQNGQVRITAARSLLEYSLKLSERVDILQRLDELEQKLNK